MANARIVRSTVAKAPRDKQTGRRLKIFSIDEYWSMHKRRYIEAPDLDTAMDVCADTWAMDNADYEEDSYTMENISEVGKRTTWGLGFEHWPASETIIPKE